MRTAILLARLPFQGSYAKRYRGGTAQNIWKFASSQTVEATPLTADYTGAETGVYGPEGQWLIEGHGVDPDIVVDNLPHATFKGEDKQLDAAIAFLKEEIRTKPMPVPAAPKYPNKAFTPIPESNGKP